MPAMAASLAQTDKTNHTPTKLIAARYAVSAFFPKPVGSSRTVSCETGLAGMSVRPINPIPQRRSPEIVLAAKDKRFMKRYH